MVTGLITLIVERQLVKFWKNSKPTDESCMKNKIDSFVDDVSYQGSLKNVTQGANSLGSTPKICRPPKAAEKFFPCHLRPGVEIAKNVLPAGYPWVTPREVFTKKSYRH